LSEQGLHRAHTSDVDQADIETVARKNGAVTRYPEHGIGCCQSRVGDPEAFGRTSGLCQGLQKTNESQQRC
jgi:hypothetical protein